MKNLVTLAALVLISASFAHAQDQTSTTRTTKIESKSALQKATPATTEAQKQAVVKKSSNVKRVSGQQMMTKQQLDAQMQERKKTQPTSTKTK
ncbi:MAG: hypothetical protein RL266_1076, partial [Bacteroidota bacterium]